jgi:hypothetical protein
MFFPKAMDIFLLAASGKNIQVIGLYCAHEIVCIRLLTVPHSGSGVASMSSLSGVELVGFWEFGMGGLIG